MSPTFQYRTFGFRLQQRSIPSIWIWKRSLVFCCHTWLLILSDPVFQSTYRPWISLLLSCLWKIVDCVEIEFIAKILYTSSTPLPFLHGLSHLTSCALVIYFLLVQGEIIWSLPATSTNKVPTCYRVIFWSVALPSHQEVCRDGFLSVPFTFRIFHVMYIRLSSHTFRRVSTHHVHYWT